MTSPTIPRTASGLPRIDTQAWYHAASDEYERCIDELEQRRTAAGEAKATLNLAREQLKDLEAEVLVNGGREQFVIDGNEVRRTAILRAALAAWPDYTTKRQEVAGAERALSQAEASRDSVANTMSLAKSRCDAYVAATQRAASLLIYGDTRATGH